MTLDADKTRREALRWYLILALYNARPQSLCEEIMLSTLQALYPDVTAHEVRRQLDYLACRDIVALRKEPCGRWWGDLTYAGADLAEYNRECPPGIGRPVKYWA